jgi:hypothetical protein
LVTAWVKLGLLVATCFITRKLHLPQQVLYVILIATIWKLRRQGGSCHYQQVKPTVSLQEQSIQIHGAGGRAILLRFRVLSIRRLVQVVPTPPPSLLKPVAEAQQVTRRPYLMPIEAAIKQTGICHQKMS